MYNNDQYGRSRPVGDQLMATRIDDLYMNNSMHKIRIIIIFKHMVFIINLTLCWAIIINKQLDINILRYIIDNIQGRQAHFHKLRLPPLRDFFFSSFVISIKLEHKHVKKIRHGILHIHTSKIVKNNIQCLK